MDISKAKELFIGNCRALDKSESTINRNIRVLNQFDEYMTDRYNRPVEIEEVRVDDLEQFMFQVYNPTEYASSTQHNAVNALKSLFTYLSRKKICVNIGRLIKNVKVETMERQTLTEFEIKKILHYIESPTIKAVILTQYYAGLRIGEALHLTLDDVDLQRNELHVRDTKNKEDRTVPINYRLEKVLGGYLSAGRTDCGTDKFFSTYPKGKICPQRVNRKLGEAKDKAGIQKDISSHNLRHSFASTLISRGVDVVTLKNLLGHRNIRTTSIYCHTDIKQLEDAVNVL